MIFSGTNGDADAVFYVLMSTNLALPTTQWTVLATNYFDNGGDFNFTNVADPACPQMFYMLQLQ